MSIFRYEKHEQRKENTQQTTIVQAAGGIVRVHVSIYKKIILKNKRKIIADYNFTIKLVKPW